MVFLRERIAGYVNFAIGWFVFRDSLLRGSFSSDLNEDKKILWILWLKIKLKWRFRVFLRERIAGNANFACGWFVFRDSLHRESLLSDLNENKKILWILWLKIKLKWRFRVFLRVRIAGNVNFAIGWFVFRDSLHRISFIRFQWKLEDFVDTLTENQVEGKV